jgi:soluble lytic murein transglycosylase-like protein
VTRSSLFNFTILAALTLFCTCAPASAQIYTWRDGSGNLVLSNTRPDGVQPTTTYTVPGSQDVRTTREHARPSSHDEYDDLIVEQARRQNVRQSLVRAVIQVESAFNPTAYSNKGAMGLMQLMPQTARELGVRNAFNPEENIRGGVAYLRQLLDRYEGNEELALAAYNAGPGAVDRHGEKIPPYRETQSYVKKINRLAGTETSPAALKIYRVVEMVDGRAVIKYTDKKPE